ncbi:hypothetical protein XHV734_0295 [Xanthomonas hortorum pv. vitians]|nr:hypothetical protein XHV734_0295 [Xanthomonas hortorum pv. vitians]
MRQGCAMDAGPCAAKQRGERGILTEPRHDTSGTDARRLAVHLRKLGKRMYAMGASRTLGRKFSANPAPHRYGRMARHQGNSG